MEPFMLYALVAGLLLTLITGPLGAFVVWRRMAYFGDAIAHSALLGAAVGIVANIDVSLGVTAAAVAVALLLLFMQYEARFSADTLLGIIAHGALSAGVVALALLPQARIDMSAYLFGDILAISMGDIYVVCVVVGLSLLLLVARWPQLVRLTLHEDLARVSGINTMRTKMLLMLLLALVVAASVKIVGILLITSLLIIPAAAARYFSSSPTQMAIVASVIGAIAVVVGLCASLKWDTPAGPSIVLAALAIFVMSLVFAARRRLA